LASAPPAPREEEEEEEAFMQKGVGIIHSVWTWVQERESVEQVTGEILREDVERARRNNK